MTFDLALTSWRWASPPLDSKARRVGMLLVALLCGIGVSLVNPVTARAAEVSPRVIIIGTSATSWSEVQDEPNVMGVGIHAAVGNLVTRSVFNRSCPEDGWLALSTGTRASTRTADDDPCGTIEMSPNGEVSGWSSYVDAVQNQKFEAKLGRLGDGLLATGVPAVAVGAGAGLALTSSAGTVAGSYLPGDTAPAAVFEKYPDAQLLVIDANAIPRPGLGQLITETVTAAKKSDPDLANTSIIAASLADLPAEGSRAGASAKTPGASPGAQPGATHPELTFGVILALGSDLAPGVLTSQSTRQPGLTLTTDIFSTVVKKLGLSVSGVTGAHLESDGNNPEVTADGLDLRVSDLVDAAAHASAAAPLVAPFMTGFGVFVGLLALFTVGISTRSRAAASARRIAPLLMFAALIPASMTLGNALPWWQVSPSWVGLVGIGALIAAALTVLVVVITGAINVPHLSAWIIPSALISGITWIVFVADVLRGAPWQVANVLGTQPLVAGRFFGMNNSSFAFFAVATLTLAAVTAHACGWRRSSSLPKWLAPTSVAVIGIVSVAINAAPSIGADLGGPLSLIPGIALLALGAANIRVRWPHLLLTIMGGAIVVGLVAVVDWMRPPGSRTHLGQFVQEVLDGEMLGTLSRKAVAAFGGVFTSVWTLLGFVATAVTITLLLLAWRRSRRDEWEIFKPWLLATGVMLVLATLANDSGPAILGLGLAFGTPLALVALVSRNKDVTHAASTSAEPAVVDG